MVSKSIGFRSRWTLAPVQGTSFPSSVAMPSRPSIFPLRSAALAATWAWISLRKIGCPRSRNGTPDGGEGFLHLVASAAVPDEEYSDSVMPDGQLSSDNVLREDRGKIVCLRGTRDRTRRARVFPNSESRLAQPPTSSLRAYRGPPWSLSKVRVVAAGRDRRRRLSLWA